MKIRLIKDNLWTDESFRQYSHNLNNLLRLHNALLIIKNGSPPYKVVIGVPHQAEIGISRIAESWSNPSGGMGRDSDENAASFALVAFSHLHNQSFSCKLVIACHFTDHDPNKDINSPYCREIFNETSMLLMECHGAGEGRRRDIEISSGSNNLIAAVDFGRKLAEATKYQYKIAAQLKGGSSKAKTILKNQEIDSRLSLPALKTRSLAFADELGIPALHIEAKPQFRISKIKDESVSADGFELGRSMAEILSLC